jgi:hypothetical protein
MGLFRGDDSESGAVLVFLIATVAVLLAVGSLVLDVGYVFARRTQLANAVDAASLAGVMELPADPVSAWAMASDYLTANYDSVDNASVVIGSDHSSVSVWASDRVKIFLGSVFGLESVGISAQAKAQIAPAARVKGVRPFGVVQQDFVYGQTYLLKSAPGSGKLAPGNFGALALGGNGANNYRNNIKYGYDGWIEVGQLILTEPGNMSGPTGQGVQYLLDQCNHYPPCTYDTVRPGCPRLLVVPVVESFDDKHGRDYVAVVGFACFFLEGYGGQGKDAYVAGRFLQRQIDARPGDAAYFGASVVRLTE